MMSLKKMYIIYNFSLNAKIIEGKGEISSITNLATNSSLNAKIIEVKSEIPNITNLATTTTTLTAVENKIPNVSNLVKKTDYNTKISEIEKKMLLIMIKINILLLLKNLRS